MTQINSAIMSQKHFIVLYRLPRLSESVEAIYSPENKGLYSKINSKPTFGSIESVIEKFREVNRVRAHY